MAGSISLTGLFGWIKENYGSDVLYSYSLREWNIAVSRKLILTERKVLKDVLSKTYKLERQSFLIARRTSEEHEQLVADGAYREFKMTQRVNSLKLAIAKSSEKEPTVEGNPEADRPDDNDEKIRERSTDGADPISDVSEGVSGSAETVQGIVRLDPVASSRKRLGEMPMERPPRYEKRARPEPPVRHPWENDTTFCFRMLSYLEMTRVISDEQNKKCRRVLIDDLSKGLTASLLQYSLDNNEKAVREFVDYVVPGPPSLLQHMVGAVKGELTRMTLRTVTAAAVKAIGYGLALVGTATVLRVKDFM